MSRSHRGGIGGVEERIGVRGLGLGNLGLIPAAGGMCTILHIREPRCSGRAAHRPRPARQQTPPPQAVVLRSRLSLQTANWKLATRGEAAIARRPRPFVKVRDALMQRSVFDSAQNRPRLNVEMEPGSPSSPMEARNMGSVPLPSHLPTVEVAELR